MKDIDWSSSSSEASFCSSPASTVATSIDEEDHYISLGGIYIVRPDAASAHHRFTPRHQHLRADIDSQLYDVLKKKHSYMVRLKLVGRTTDNFRPAILLSTSSPRTKLALTSYLLTGPPFMRNLAECQLDLHVILTSEGAAAGLAEDDLLENASSPGNGDILVGSRSETCGTRIYMRSSGSTYWQQCIGGGTLLLDGKPVLATTCHAWLAQTGKNPVWQEATKPLKLDSAQEDLKEAFSVYFDELQTSEQQRFDHSKDPSIPDALVPTSDTKYSLPPSDNLSVYEDVVSVGTSPFISPSPYANEDKGRAANLRGFDNQDTYALASLCYQSQVADVMTLQLERPGFSSSATPPNTTVNRIAGYTVDRAFTQESFTSLPITIALPEGEVKGHLQPELVIYRIGDIKLELRCVTVSAPLRRGCSGAWVAFEDQLCGTIIAISDDQPEVFILPFNQISEELKRISGCLIELPKEDSKYALSRMTDAGVPSMDDPFQDPADESGVDMNHCEPRLFNSADLTSADHDDSRKTRPAFTDYWTQIQGSEADPHDWERFYEPLDTAPLSSQSEVKSLKVRIVELLRHSGPKLTSTWHPRFLPRSYSYFGIDIAGDCLSEPRDSDVHSRVHPNFADYREMFIDTERERNIRKVFQCQHCPHGLEKSFKFMSHLMKHVRSFHNVVPVDKRVWVCGMPDCSARSKVWRRLDNFKQHIMSMHGTADTGKYHPETMSEHYDSMRHNSIEVYDHGSLMSKVQNELPQDSSPYTPGLETCHSATAKKGKKPAATRRRTKTGCLTCRQRRVKLDVRCGTCKIFDRHRRRIVEPSSEVSTSGPSWYDQYTKIPYTKQDRGIPRWDSIIGEVSEKPNDTGLIDRARGGTTSVSKSTTPYSPGDSRPVTADLCNTPDIRSLKRVVSEVNTWLHNIDNAELESDPWPEPNPSLDILDGHNPKTHLQLGSEVESKPAHF